MTQQDLLPIFQDRLPPGVYLTEGYITPDEELRLVEEIDKGEWETAVRMDRRIQQFGWAYDYLQKKTTPAPPPPGYLRPLRKELYTLGWLRMGAPAVIINEYTPGQGIAAHTDSEEYGDTVVDVSLLDSWVMEFTKGDQIIPVLLPRRSIMLMTGEARWEWKHAISTRLTDHWHGRAHRRQRRISITFRDSAKISE